MTSKLVQFELEFIAFEGNNTMMRKALSNSNWSLEPSKRANSKGNGSAGAGQLSIFIILEAQTTHNKLAVTHENRLACD